MAPERTGHSSFANNSRKESLTPQKQPSFYENFIEIKIKDELEIQEDIITGEEGEVVVYSECEPEVGVKSSEDHDLTSLSWLQSNNLLKSKPLHLQEQRKKAVLEESPTSDLTEETESECSMSQSPSSRMSPQTVHMEPQDIALNIEARTSEKYTGRHYGGKEKHHYSVPYDPHLHVNSKPPYSFSCLIFMAIEDSHARALPVKEIYSWITDHFPYFNKAPTGWKNSVRHNLSLNKCFRKVDKAPNLGKGSLWIVDPQYRPNLLNALSKAPYHPCASLDRSPKAPILPPATLTPQQQDFIQIKTQNRLPNPELFPYLSKRLAASEADRMNEADDSDDDSLDDVDAATAMLELKHGQREQLGKWRKRSKMAHGEMKLLISTSPSEDHTYTVDRVKTYKQKQPLSPDEAYVGGSDSNDDNSLEFLDENEESWSSDGAEQRNVASALLHLAGGSRKRSSSTEVLKSGRGRRNARQPILQRTLKKASFRANAARRDEALNNNSASGGDKYNYPKPKMTDYLIYGRGSR